MSPAIFCKCGAPVCGARCCKTEQDPKTCDGVYKKGTRGFQKVPKKVDWFED